MSLSIRFHPAASCSRVLRFPIDDTRSSRTWRFLQKALVRWRHLVVCEQLQRHHDNFQARRSAEVPIRALAKATFRVWAAVVVRVQSSSRTAATIRRRSVFCLVESITLAFLSHLWSHWKFSLQLAQEKKKFRRAECRYVILGLIRSKTSRLAQDVMTNWHDWILRKRFEQKAPQPWGNISRLQQVACVAKLSMVRLQRVDFIIALLQEWCREVYRTRRKRVLLDRQLLQGQGLSPSQQRSTRSSWQLRAEGVKAKQSLRREPLSLLRTFLVVWRQEVKARKYQARAKLTEQKLVARLEGVLEHSGASPLASTFAVWMESALRYQNAQRASHIQELQYQAQQLHQKVESLRQHTSYGRLQQERTHRFLAQALALLSSTKTHSALQLTVTLWWQYTCVAVHERLLDGSTRSQSLVREKMVRALVRMLAIQYHLSAVQVMNAWYAAIQRGRIAKKTHEAAALTEKFLESLHVREDRTYLNSVLVCVSLVKNHHAGLLRAAFASWKLEFCDSRHARVERAWARRCATSALEEWLLHKETQLREKAWSGWFGQLYRKTKKAQEDHDNLKKALQNEINKQKELREQLEKVGIEDEEKTTYLEDQLAKRDMDLVDRQKMHKAEIVALEAQKEAAKAQARADIEAMKRNHAEQALDAEERAKLAKFRIDALEADRKNLEEKAKKAQEYNDHEKKALQNEINKQKELREQLEKVGIEDEDKTTYLEDQLAKRDMDLDFLHEKAQHLNDMVRNRALQTAVQWISSQEKLLLQILFTTWRVQIDESLRSSGRAGLPHDLSSERTCVQKVVSLAFAVERYAPLSVVATAGLVVDSRREVQHLKELFSNLGKAYSTHLTKIGAVGASDFLLYVVNAAWKQAVLSRKEWRASLLHMRCYAGAARAITAMAQVHNSTLMKFVFSAWRWLSLQAADMKQWQFVQSAHVHAMSNHARCLLSRLTCHLELLNVQNVLSCWSLVARLMYETRRVKEHGERIHIAWHWQAELRWMLALRDSIFSAWAGQVRHARFLRYAVFSVNRMDALVRCVNVDALIRGVLLAWKSSLSDAHAAHYKDESDRCAVILEDFSRREAIKSQESCTTSLIQVAFYRWARRHTGRKATPACDSIGMQTLQIVFIMWRIVADDRRREESIVKLQSDVDRMTRELIVARASSERRRDHSLAIMEGSMNAALFAGAVKLSVKASLPQIQAKPADAG